VAHLKRHESIAMLEAMLGIEPVEIEHAE